MYNFIGVIGYGFCIICLLILLLQIYVQFFTNWMKYKTISVKILRGEYAGFEGNIVSIPWMGNWWNTFPEINISTVEDDGLHIVWIKVPIWWCERI